MKPVDSHCHVDFEKFNKDRKQVIQSARSKLEYVVNPGISKSSNKKVIKLSEEYNDFIVPNLGLHPAYEENFNQLEEVKAQIKKHKPPAIGEIGLDHHHIKEEKIRDRQEKVFRELLSTAEKRDIPVVIHSRDAEKKVANIISEYSLNNVFLHCFNGNVELAKELVNSGVKLGITTQVLYSNRVQNIVEQIDIEHMILETDSPFLYRNGRNEPINVLESIKKISEIKQLSEKKIINKTTKNSRKIFR